MTIGVYKLNFSDGSFYIGRSSNIEVRITSHISEFKNNKSNYKILEKKASGIVITGYDILEECSSIEESKTKEIYYIKAYEALEKGLNISPGGEDILYGEKNSRSKYTNEQLYRVLVLLGEGRTQKDISSELNVSINVVKEVSCGSKHIWLMEAYPIEYQRMLDNKSSRQARSLANLDKACKFKTKLEVLPKLVSPEGKIVEIEGTLTSFAEKHNLQLGNLSSVINGGRLSHKGWSVYKGE